MMFGLLLLFITQSHAQILTEREEQPKILFSEEEARTTGLINISLKGGYLPMIKLNGLWFTMKELEEMERKANRRCK